MAPRKYLYVFFIVFIHWSAFAQTNGAINIGHVDTIYSSILNESRPIWIHVPEGSESNIYEPTSYPVIYLLDGDAHFSSVVGMVDQLSSVNGNSICPKMIVVGIPNTDRTRDLTPTKASSDHPFVDSTMAAHSGGGEAFMDFMEKELIPYIESHYSTQPFRMLIGHSFGGLTAINTLFKRPDLFKAYLALDPSMWWDNQRLLHEIQQAGNKPGYQNRWLYLGIANTMDHEKDTLVGLQDTTVATEHIRNIIYLNRFYDHLQISPFKYDSKFYPDDDHGSVPLIATYDALRFFFKSYPVTISFEDFMNPDLDLAAKIQKHYEQVSVDFGYEIKPDESLINLIGYQFLGMKQLEKAEKFFLLNTVNHPKSFNAFDSLGDCYQEMGKKEKAIESYQKSIELNPDSYSKEKLEALKSNK